MARALTSIIARLASTESGSFCFQPRSVPLEAADVLVEFSLPFWRLTVVAGPIAAEHRAPRLQELPLPRTDLVGMDPMLAGQFIDRLQPLRGFQGQLELALRTIALAWLRHGFDPPLAGLRIVSFHLNQWSSF